MRFCKVCELAMAREIGSGAVVFTCPCGARETGDAVDARISGHQYGAGKTRSMYGHIVSTAAHDRTSQLVWRDCPNCGLDYMAQVRVGAEEIIIHVCSCGYSSNA